MSQEEDWKPMPAAEPPGRFEKIASPSTVDYALRTLQQSLVQFSAMADAKANILITICALVFSVGLTQLHRVEAKAPLLVLLSSAAVSLLLAILAVVPRSSRPAPPDRRGADGPRFNPLFFMHFSELEPERYLDVMDALMRDSTRVYEALLRDIHGQGTSLARKKYRLLRWSYSALLAGVSTALLLLVSQQLV